MLSSASNVAAWARKGRDVDRLINSGSTASQARVGASVSIRSRANAASHVNKRLLKSTVSTEGRVCASLITPTLLKAGVRDYHTTSVMEKKKEVNTKSIATQGRRKADKSEGESGVRLQMVPGPQTKRSEVQRVKTSDELIAEHAKRAEAAASKPSGLIIDQKKMILTETLETGGKMPQMAEAVRRLREKYPATYNVMRYQWARMPPSMRARLVQEGQDYRVIKKDPDMQHFVQWLNKFDGRDDTESYLRMVIRRDVVGQKLQLASLWKETDAGLAELRSESDLAEIHFPSGEVDGFVPEEELAELDAEERKELDHLLNNNLLDDPEIQVVLNYMVWPRASIDPMGKLKAAIEPDFFTEVDLLSLAQSRPLINQLALGMKRNIMQELPEVVQEDVKAIFELSTKKPSPELEPEAYAAYERRQKAAREHLDKAHQQGLLDSPAFQDQVAEFKNNFQVDFVPDAVALRLLLDSAHSMTKKIVPEYAALIEQYGSEVAEEIVTERLRTLMDEEELAARTEQLEDEAAFQSARDESTAAMLDIVDAEENDAAALANSAAASTSASRSPTSGAVAGGNTATRDAAALEAVEDEFSPVASSLPRETTNSWSMGDEDVDEVEEIYSDLIEELESADTEMGEIAIIPAYADEVTRELTDVIAADTLPMSDAERKQLTEEYEADLQAYMNFESVPGKFRSESDRQWLSAKTPEEQLAVVKKLLGIGDATLRQTARLIFQEYVKDIMIKTCHMDPMTVEDPTLELMAQEINRVISSGSEKLTSEQQKKLANLATMLRELNDGEDVNSMPVENPEKQFGELMHTLQYGKDVLLARNESLNSIEPRLDAIFKRAREMSQKMAESKHPLIVQLEKDFATAYGSPVPDHMADIGADEIMEHWSTQMQQEIVMLEARTAVQRERDTVQRLLDTQMDPINTTERGPARQARDNGMWEFTSSDVAQLRPVEERIYVSSDKEIDQIFTEENVGKYIVLSANDLKRHLPEGFSRPLTKQEFPNTKTHALLIRPQAIEAINNLKAQLNNSFLAEHSLARLSTASSSTSEATNSAESKATKAGTKAGKATKATKTKKANATKSAAPVETPRPMILHGYRGCGKSAIFSQVVYWARRNDWLVITVPDSYEALASGVYITKNATEGTWDQPKLFVRFFLNLLNAHSDKLSQIPLKTQNAKIGKQTFKTLFDVVEYGSVLEQAAAQCFTIFKNEIRKVVEFPVLLACDSYNAFYVPSRDFRNPESTTYHKLPLDPRDMTFGKLFYDAHLNPRLAYGTFLGALTEDVPVRPFLQRDPPATRGVPMVQPKFLEVQPYSPTEFNTVMEHYKHKNWIRTNMHSGSASELYIYQITSGFGNAVWSFTSRL